MYRAQIEYFAKKITLQGLDGGRVVVLRKEKNLISNYIIYILGFLIFFKKLDDNSDFYFYFQYGHFGELSSPPAQQHHIIQKDKFSTQILKHEKKNLSKKMIIDLSEICFGFNLLFGNRCKLCFIKNLIFKRKLSFLYILNCFDALILKIIFKNKKILFYYILI